jgi:hypothetical protein
MPLLSTKRFISSAVKTWASPFLIFSLISSIVRVFCLGLSFVYLQPMPNPMAHPLINTFWDFAFNPAGDYVSGASSRDNWLSVIFVGECKV